MSMSGWDARIREHGGHLLQSEQWAAFKRHGGWVPDRIAVERDNAGILAQVLYRSRGPISLGYIPRGPVTYGNTDQLWPEFLKEMRKSARRHRAMNIIVEPNGPLEIGGASHGFVDGPMHLQPGRTVKIPLGTDDEILKGMRQKTRYAVRLAERRGVTVRREIDAERGVGIFYGLLEDTAKRNQFFIHDQAYYQDFVSTFGDDALLIIAESEGVIGSVLIAAAFGNEAIYMYGASSTEHRTHSGTFLLQFEAMRWARDRGCTHYDLWGIPEQDPESVADESGNVSGTKGDDWRGLYRFKTGFGGEIIDYPPALEMRYLPILPWAARKFGIIRG